VNNNLFSKDSTWPEDTQAAGNYLVSTEELNTFFVDYENFDFHLKAGATVIDEGSNLDYAPFDIEGNERPVGEGVDPGAFEYLP
jgi:hypothetical protein